VSDLFWLSEAQMGRLAPLLPTDTRGKARVRGWTTGASSAASSKCCGRVAPGGTPRGSTVHRRRCTTAMFAGRSKGSGGVSSRRSQPPAARPLRSCWMRPTRRRIAAPRAGKGGARASHRALAWRANHQDPRGGQPRRQADRVPPLGRQHSRSPRRRGADRRRSRGRIGDR